MKIVITADMAAYVDLVTLFDREMRKQIQEDLLNLALQVDFEAAT